MNNLDKQYTALLQDILDNGVTKQTRNGGTMSVFGRQIRHKMSDGFPLLTTKKLHFKSIVVELLWFLRGDTNIKFLVDNGCHIWDGDAYKNYKQKIEHGLNSMFLRNEGPNKIVPLSQEEFINKIKTDDEFAERWGELGPIYGKQWRGWSGASYIFPPDANEAIHQQWYRMGVNSVANKEIDQIENLISELKTNPDSRRLMVNAWNVGELDQMVLPPCHTDFQFYTRELSHKERCDLFGHNDSLDRDYSYSKWLDDNGYPKRAISLMWNQRSVDTFLGLPFNIASYGLLLEIIAKSVNMIPDELIGNLGDVHLYSNHIEQAKEQIGKELTIEERINIASSDIHFDPGDFGIGEHVSDESMHATCDLYGAPRRTRQPYELPKLNINTEFWPYEGGECGEGPLDAVKVFESFKNDNFCKCLLEEDIQLSNYQSHPTIKAPLSN
jgi:thymidylate synthase